MKTLNLFIAGLGLAIAPAAFADEKPTSGTIYNEGQASVEINPLKRKVGELEFSVKRMTVTEFLRLLALRSGKQISFDAAIKEGALINAAQFWGTPETIAKSVASIYDLQIVMNDKEWKVAPDNTPKKPAPPLQLRVMGTKIVIERRSELETPAPLIRPDGMQMNINPTPGKNMPEGAVPFEFNEKQIYRVPIR